MNNKMELFEKLYDENAVNINFRKDNKKLSILKSISNMYIIEYNQNVGENVDIKEIFGFISNCIKILEKKVLQIKLTEDENSLFSNMKDVFGYEKVAGIIRKIAIDKSFGYSYVESVKTEILTKRAPWDYKEILDYHNGIHFNTFNMSGEKVTFSLELTKEELDDLIENLVELSESVETLE